MAKKQQKNQSGQKDLQRSEGLVNFVKTEPYMVRKDEIIVKDAVIKTMSREGIDYIGITDIAKQKNWMDPNGIIANWMRNRNTIEFLGIWETLYNPSFNPLEFEGFRKQAGLNVALFGVTAREWRDGNPELKGNIRDYATINQLICLSNLENLNAVFINEGMPQAERLRKLNTIAIQQMSVLEERTSVRQLLK